MLSVFPEFLNYSFFAPSILRVALAILFGYAAWQHLASSSNSMAKVSGIVEVIASIALLAGFYTQPVALLGVGIFFSHAAVPQLRVLPPSTGLLALAMCLSLLILGPGALAFDFPL